MQSINSLLPYHPTSKPLLKTSCRLRRGILPSNLCFSLLPQLALFYRDDADESYLGSSAYEATCLLIANSAKDCVKSITLLLPVFLSRLEQTFAMEVVSADDKEARSELQGHLCGALQVWFLC